MKRSLGIVFLMGMLAVAGRVLANEARVENLKVAVHPQSGLTVVGGEVVLPGKGVWYVPAVDSAESSVAHVLLDVPEKVLLAATGMRARAIQNEQLKQSHQWELRGAHWRLKRWARENEGRMPRLDELDEDGRKALEEAFDSLPALRETLLNPPAAPHAAFVPDAVFEFKPDSKYGAATNAAPILVELHPLEDDGKHYVLRTSGTFERESIDKKLMARLGLQVVPLKLDPAAGQYPETATYRLLAQRRQPGAAQISITNETTGAAMFVVCPEPDGTPDADGALLREWGEWQRGEWDYLANAYDAPGLRTWAWIRQGMLEGKWVPEQEGRDRGATTDMMGVLGGRAALRETLQLEALVVDGSNHTDRVAMETLAGVEVKSHPFDEMLAGSDGGRYPIADYVPHDRFFMGLSKPDALLPLLDEAGAFLARVGAGATGRSLHYGIKERYLQALGLDESKVRILLETGVIEEMALFSPDLFYVDGTELTAIVRMRGAVGVKMIFSLAGLSGHAGKSPVALKTVDGGEAWWALVDGLVVVGTSQREVESVVSLAAKAGADSLGRSAEFRYMLTRVPLTEKTRAYVYFSDPFIRRLVGPEVKIGQVRRLREKARMQAMVHASMLRAHDGQGEDGTLEQLTGEVYLPPSFRASGLTFGEGGIPVSETYGPLPRMGSINAADLSMATAAETNAYTNYKVNYSRYWRRFFDPVAMRIDDAGDELVATTYILPLLDNSLYDGLREIVNADPSRPLRIPEIEPAPSAMLSLNLGEEAWREMLGETLFGMFRGIGTDTAALDQLGPAFHFAVFDGDPIVAFGSRSMLGLGGSFGDGEEMLISLLVSQLTRPCAMLVELQDPAPVRAFLENNGLAEMLETYDDDMKINSYRLEGKDHWVLGMDFWGLALRFSFAIDGNYLIIGNMPWRESLAVARETDAAVSGAAIRIVPSAAKIERRALHLSAMEGQRLATMEGLAYLYPLLAAGVPPEEALARHRELFGFGPVLPGGASPAWDGFVPGCPGFGNLLAPEQPAYDPEKTFGTLQGIKQLSASMQFEETGLRTIVRWHYKKP
ncbi:MAG: hypothetical protein DRP64_03785 [Verrucomicrobia bacterium]|nr:MAG: hypothetical protein DRP64_03785 [Verrucomicrobiota bacterium]